MKSKMFVILCLLCVVAPGIATAAIYKWVDAKGVITFRDTPPPDAANVKNLEVRPGVAAPPRTENTPVAETAAGEQKPATETTIPETTATPAAEVELFTTSWCPYCKQAAAFLRSRGVAFVEYDIEKDAAAARRKDELDSRKGVPFAMIYGYKVHGFSEEAYLNALDQKE